MVTEFLNRKTVLNALGGWRRLRAAEQAGHLRRYYPLGLKHARYRRSELQRLLDGLLTPAT
jgi:hypothetical protein